MSKPALLRRDRLVRSLFVAAVVVATTGKPTVRAAVLSEIATVYTFGTFDEVVRDFGGGSDCFCLALARLLIQRAQLWWPRRREAR
jgi:hypothetical protein